MGSSYCWLNAAPPAQFLSARLYRGSRYGDNPGASSRVPLIVAPEARIIVVTGVTTPEKVQEALERGARFSFTKPLHFTALGQVADSLIAERKEGLGTKERGAGNGRGAAPSR